MGKKKWEHLFISPSMGRPPMLDSIYDDKGNLKTGRTLGQTYACRELFPQGQVHFSLSWFYDVPDVNPIVGEHVHQEDELVFYLPSFNHKDDDINAVWGEATVYIEGEPYTVTDNCCIYVPGGVPHGPFQWNRVDRPHMFLTVLLNGDYTRLMDGRKYAQVNGQYVPVDEPEKGV